MSYTQKTWKDGDVITAESMNNIEKGTTEAILQAPVTHERLALDKVNLYYNVGDIMEATCCRGYDKSTFEAVTQTNANYDTWVVNIQDLSAYESITIPLEDVYDNTNVLTLLGPAWGSVYSAESIKTLKNAVYNETEKTITLLTSIILWYAKERDAEKVYFTKKRGRNFIYAPKSFDVLGYIKDNTIPVEKIKQDERLVCYNQLRIVEGDVITLFPDNVLLGHTAEKYAAVKYDVTGISGYEQRGQRLVVYGDGVDDAGGQVTITYYKENTIKPTLSTTINVYKVSKTYGEGKTKKILCLGDSYLYGGTAEDYVLQMFDNDVMNVEAIGTSPGRIEGELFNSVYHSNVNDDGTIVPYLTYWKKYGINPQPSDIASYRPIPANEGRGGWAPYSYCNKASHNGAENAFMNPDTGKFDFSYYMNQSGYDGVDMVLLGMGMNSVTVKVDGVLPTLEQDAAAWKEIIDSIHAYDSNIVILIWLTNPPGQLNGDHCIFEKDKRLEVVEHLITTYQGRYTDKIYLIPTGIAVNTIEGFTLGEWYQGNPYGGGGRPVDGTNWHKERYHTDILHPNEYGYQQIATVLYAWIKYLAYK